MFKIILRISLGLLPVLFIFCKSPEVDLTYSSEDLKLIPVSENSYLHISYLELSNGSIFPCNGLIYVNQGEAVIFDTPTKNKTTQELIDWLTKANKLSIVGLVANHFHDDCIGGIGAFHQNGITTYANQTTISQIMEPGIKPQKSFVGKMTLNVGSGVVINRFFGEAHTRDNIVSYIPEEELLFGGCMIKSWNATKGNLADANEDEWANTVLRIKEAYPSLEIIVPGHGDPGDLSLLDYTAQLFSTK